MPTTEERRRGLGEIGKGVGRGLLLHAMLAVDADTNGCLGLVPGRLWTRPGRRRVDHGKRPLADKESQRWLSTAEAAKSVLAAVTVVADRESDIYAEWARLPGPRFHLADPRHARPGHRRRRPAEQRAAGTGRRGRGRSGRPCWQAGVAWVTLAARFGRVTLTRPRSPRETGLPKTVPVSLVEVVEQDPPPGAEPILWRLLTTHQSLPGLDPGSPTRPWLGG